MVAKKNDCTSNRCHCYKDNRKFGPGCTCLNCANITNEVDLSKIVETESSESEYSEMSDE